MITFEEGGRGEDESDNNGRRGDSNRDINKDRIAEKVSKEVMKGLGILPQKSLQFIVYEAVHECFKEQTKPAEKEKDSKWSESEEMLTCEICLQLSILEVPAALNKFRKGHYGIIQKEQSSFHLSRSMKLHEKNPLHLWCLKETEKIRTEILARKSGLTTAFKNNGQQEFFSYRELFFRKHLT